MSSGSLPVRPGRAHTSTRTAAKKQRARVTRRMFFEPLEARAMMAFTPGDVWRFGNTGNESYVHPVSGSGGMGSPFGQMTGQAFGQIAWSTDLSTAYTTNYNNGALDAGTVVAINSNGETTTFATGLDSPTGLIRTADGRLLVAESTTGNIVDITAGGDASGAPKFASGLSTPRNLLQRANGQILVVESGSDEITDIAVGGNLSGAAPFATLAAVASLSDIVESTSGALYAADYSQGRVYDISAGGDLTAASPFATGRKFIGLAVDLNGRLLANATGLSEGGGNIYDITTGGDFASAVPLISHLPNGTAAIDTVPLRPTIELTVHNGNLTITDTEGRANDLKISVSGGNLVISDPGAIFSAGLGNVHSIAIPLASITGALILETGAGDDTVTVDLSAGNAIPAGGIVYNGGSQATSFPGDVLVIEGGVQSTVIYNYTNAHDGSIELIGFGTIIYTGLEPITNTGDVDHAIYNLPAGAQGTLEDDGIAGNDMSRLVSTNSSFELTNIPTPNLSLTINAGGTNTISISSLDSLFDTPSLVLNGAASDTFRLTASNVIPDNTSLTLGNAATFDLQTFSEQVAALSSVAGTTIVKGGAGSKLTVSGAASSTFAGRLNDSLAFEKSGSGTLTLSNTGSTFTGAVAVSGGVLEFNGTNINSLGAGAKNVTLTNNAAIRPITGPADPATGTKSFIIGTGGGTFDTSAGFNLLLNDAGQLQGTGLLTITGGATGAVQLGGAYTNSGGVLLQSGTLQLNAGSTVTSGALVNGPIGTGLLTINGGTIRTDGTARTLNNSVLVTGDFTVGAASGSQNLTFNHSAVTSPANGTFTISGPRTITVAGGGQSITGTIAGTNSPSLTKSGPADLILNGGTAASTFGTLNVNTGRLFFTGGSAAGAQNALGTGTINVGASGGLVYNSNFALTLTNQINTVNGSNLANRQNTWTLAGATTSLPTSGTIVFNRDDQNSSTIIVNGAIPLTGNLIIQGGNTGAGGNGGTVQFSGVISGGFDVTKTGNGNAIFAVANSYTGVTSVLHGTLMSNVNVPAAAGTDGGFGNASSPILVGDTTGANSAALLTNGGITFSRPITIQAGSTGVKAIGGNGANSTINGTITLNDHLTLRGNANTTTINSILADTAGSRNITKDGGATVTLGAANTYTGTTTVLAGALSIAADNRLGTVPAAFTPNSIILNGGTLQAAAGFTLNANRGISLGSSTGVGTGTIDVSGTNVLTYNGVIADNPGVDGDRLFKNGSGVLVLGNANTYGGTTYVNTGTLRVLNANALGGTATGTRVNSGATLEIGAGINLAAEGIAISGNGVNGIGALNAAGNVTIASLIGIAGNATIGSSTAGATLLLTGEIAKEVDSDIAFTGIGNITVDSAIGNISPQPTFTGLVGRLFHNSTNRNIAGVTGTSNINTLAFTDAASQTATLGTTPLFFASDSDQRFTSFFGGTQPNTTNFTAVFVGDVTIPVAGLYSFSFSNNDDSTVVWVDVNDNGTFEIEERLASVTSTGNTGVIGSVNLPAGTYKIAYAVEDTGGGSGIVARYAANLAAPHITSTAMQIINRPQFPGSNSIIKNGAGTLRLAGANSYGGATIVNAGTLVVASNTALGAIGGTSIVPTATTFSTVWQVGTDNGSNSEFVAENGNVNAAPGQAGAVVDDDWYFAGTYPAPIGNVATDDPASAFERALTIGDHTKRIHFNVAAGQTDDFFRLVIDSVSNSTTGGEIPFDVYVNGVLVHQETSLTVADRTMTTAVFNGRDVNLTTGDNVVTLTRKPNGAAWMQFDYIRLESQAAAPVENTVIAAAATLAFDGGVNVGAEPVALGSITPIIAPNTIRNISGLNSFAGNITLAGNASFIDSVAGHLTLSGTITMGLSDLTVTGAGNTTLSGTINGSSTTTSTILPGLQEGSLAGSFNEAAPNPGITTQLGIRTGQTTTLPPWADNTTWVYTGQFFDADGVFAFAENIDDSVSIYIDGVLRLRNGNWDVATTTGSTSGHRTQNATTASPEGSAIANANPNGTLTSFGMGPNGDGWHTIEIRLGNGTGGAGPSNQNANPPDSGWTSTFGFGLNSSNNTAQLQFANGTISGYAAPADPGNATLFRVIAPLGTSKLTKQGIGTLALSGVNNYSGSTTVSAGTLLVNSSLASPTSVASGASLGGTGSLTGAVTLAAGSAVRPGDSLAVDTTDDLAFVGPLALTTAGTYNVEFAGTAAGTFDQVVAPSVSLGGATLSVSELGNAINNSVGQTFVIISNTGAAAVTGTFAGLLEGALVNVAGGEAMYISYVGGDGNDVVLSTQPIVNGTAGIDEVTVTALAGGNISVSYSLNGGAVVGGYTTTTPPTSFDFLGNDGNDVLNVQLAGNAATLPTINYVGGGPVAPGAGDVLHVQGTKVETARYLSDATVARAGTITLAGIGVINFTGLEPVNMFDLALAQVNFANGDDVVTLADGFGATPLTAADPAIVVSGTSGGLAFESVHLHGNTSVVINTATNGVNGADTITLNQIVGAHDNTNLSIDTAGTAADVINVNGEVRFTAAGSAVSLASGGNIAFGANGYLNATSATSTVTLTAGSAITDSDADVDVAAGSLNATSGAAVGISLDFNVGQLTTNSATGNGAQDLNQLSGTATIQSLNAGTGTATLTGLFATTGTTAISDTTAVVVNTSLTLGGNETIGSLAGAGIVALGANTLTTGGNGQSTTFSGAMNGTGGLAKTGTGNFALSGANTFTGTATVNGGTLTLAGGAALADSVAVSLANTAGVNLVLTSSETIGSLTGGGSTGGNVNLNANTLITGGNNAATTFSGVISGAGGNLTKTGTGTFTLAGSLANTFSGLTTVNRGQLALNKSVGVNAIGGDATVTGIDATTFGTLTLSQSNQLPDTANINVSGTGRMNFGNRNETFASFTQAATGGGLGDTGALGGGNGGTVVVTGATTVSAGTWQINSGGKWTTNSFALSGLSVGLNGNSNIAQTELVIGAGGLTLTGSNINLLLGTAAGALGSKLTLNGNVTTVGAAGGSGINASGTDPNGTRVVDLGGVNRVFNIADGAAAPDFTVSVGMTNGGVTKSGLGTMRVSGANAYAGPTAIDDGTFELATNGTISNTSAITVGTVATPATLNLNNPATYTLLTGNLTIVNGTSAGAVNLNAGDVTINGAVVDGGTSSLFANNGILTITNGLAVDTLSIANTTVGGAENATVRVTGGAVTLGTGTGDLNIGGRSATAPSSNTPTIGVLDLSGASSVNISYANVLLGRNTAASSPTNTIGNNTRGSLLLSLTGSNTITTTSELVIGDSASAANITDLGAAGFGPEDGNRLILGNASNTINTGVLRLGAQRSNGDMRFAGVGGNLVLRGASGGTSTTNVAIAGNNAASNDTITSGVMDLTGGTFTGQFGSLVIGRHGAGTGGAEGTLTFEAGTATIATSLTLAVPNNGGDSTAEQNVKGTINLNGSAQLIVNSTTFTEGDAIPGDGNAVATVNINGGTLRFRNLVRQQGTFNVNFNSGVIANVAGQNLTDSNVGISLLTSGVHQFDVQAGQSATFQAGAVLSGVGALTKTGGGNLILQADNTYSGNTNVSAGTLTLQHASNNNIAASPNVTVAAGATLNVTGFSGGRFDVVNGQTLRGEGTVTGTLQVNAGGQIAPGMSPGILNTGSVSFVGGNFAVEIEGDTAGNGAGFHDQLNVTGTVSLGAGVATLSVSGPFVANLPSGPLQDFVIISNDGADDTTGYFAGLQEGSAITLNGRTLYITYNGGDGNDVVLNTQPILSGTSASDVLEITPLAGGDLQYTFTAGPLAGTSGTIVAPQNFHFGGNAGDDVLILNANGNPLPAGGITFDGESQSGTNPPTPANGDALKLVGSGQDAIYRPDASVTGQGVIVVSGPGGGTIGFTGLEPVDMSGFGNLTLQLLNAADLITIAEGFDSVTGLIPALVLSGSSGGVAIEALHAWNNGSVIVDTTVSDGNDTVTVTGAANAHANANLVLETGTGADSVTFSGAATFTGGNVMVDSQAIAVDSLITAASVDLDANSGAITTTGAAIDVAATTLTAAAGTGINLDTQVVDLSASVTGAGNLQIDELDALNLTGLSLTGGNAVLTAGGSLSDSLGAVIAVLGNATLTAAGVVLGDDAGDSTNFGSVTVVSSAGVAISEDSSLDLAGASSGVGSVVLSSTDGSFALPAGASISVSGAGSDITLSVADDVVIGGSITAVDRLSIILDGGVADVGGSSLSIAATSVITTGGGATGGTVITGGAEADLFSFRPQTTTAFVVDGGAPVLPVTPGDVLDLDLTGFAAGSTILTLGATAGSGSYSFAAPQSEQSVSYTSIETVDADITGGYHLVLDLGFSGLENGAADTVDARLSTGGGANLELSVNSLPFFSGVAASIRSLTVIGSDDADTFTLTEVEGQLPSFVAAAPPVDNTAIGGGASLGAHQNATSAAVLGAQAVTIHFAGGAGSNTVGLVLTSTDDAAYFADTVGADQSGNLAVPADTLVSFAGAANLNLTGAGGSLTVDASSTPAVSTITLASPAAGQTSISGNVDLATSLAQGFAGLSVLGGDGAETIEVLAVGAGLTSLTLSGNNRAGTDAAADTLRVHTLPAGITTASLLGGAGSDTFQLYSSTSTVDGILSPVTVNGSDGNVGGNTDTLVVIDSGDADGDVVSITQNSLEGLTGYSGTPDVSYLNIDVLTVTATAGADTITTTLAAGSDLNVVTVNGNDSADQFYLSLPDPGAGPGSGIATVNLSGDAGNDSFGDATTRIQPSRTTAVNINGGAPTPGGLPTGNTVGDHLSLDLSAIPTTSAVIVTTVPGQVNASGYASFSFADIEDLDLYDSTGLTTIEMGDLYARGTEQADSFVFTNGWLPEQPSLMRVMINSFGGYLTIPGKIVVYARGGNDYLTQHDTPRIAHFYGEGGNDYLAGALQADLLVGGLNDDQLLGSSGNDTIWGDEGPTPANPAPQDDVAGGFDRINGGLGNDIIYAGGGNDQAFGNGDDDYLHGGQGDDTLDGGEGNDRVYGSAGNDQLSGYFGYDLLSGGEGNDILTGNSGNDVLIGGLGSDSLVGNDDSDLMVTGTTVPVGAGATSANSTTAGDANDQALLALLLAWGTTGTDRTLLGTVTQDGVYDEVFSGNGNDEITRDNPLDRLFDFTTGQDEEF